MKEFKPFKEGKVREVYDNGDSLIIVATDRISAFDNILKNRITDKGAILTQMSKFWFDFTKDVVPNHMISVDVRDMPEFFQQEKFDGNSMMCRKLEMLPIECIVRGYITGSGWESYKKTGKVCGIELPEGLKESDKLPEPVYTPSTKAEIGDHDENISYEQSIVHLEKYFPGKGEEYAKKIKDYTIALYKKCAEYALTKGIIIADTKFEFGLDEDGNIVIGDEMLTPDSSRFWPVEGYEPGHGQPSFDKQFARDWLTSHPDNDWNLPDDIVQKTIDKYLQCYKMITGEELKAGDVLIGMASTGVHSNGFSLVRKVFDMTKESLDTYYEELGTTLGEALLAPTRIYVKALKSIKNAGVRVHACSHITGGGFYENIPRMLKEGTRAVVEKNSYPVLPIFKLLAEKGNIDEQMMYNTYNMGLGMILAVDAADVDKTMEAIKAAGDTPYVVGRIEDGEKGVTLC